MSRELIKTLREYADKAEAGDKLHWATAMRQAAEYIRADLDKPLPEPIKMTNARPTSPGWYWYELPGSWALQPALVFDGGVGFGLFYTIDPIDSDHEDYNRDGLEMNKCCENVRWSSLPINSLYTEPPARKPLSDDFLSQVLNEGDGTYRP